jgi:hypothetical protein
MMKLEKHVANFEKIKEEGNYYSD